MFFPRILCASASPGGFLSVFPEASTRSCAHPQLLHKRTANSCCDRFASGAKWLPETLDVLSVCRNIAADQRFRQFSRVNCRRDLPSACARSGCPGVAASSMGPPHGRTEPLAIAVTAGWQDPQSVLKYPFPRERDISACAPLLCGDGKGRSGYLPSNAA